MPRKKKASASTEPQLKFEDLSVGECLALIDDLCEERARYVKFGKDFRRAWDVMQKISAHRETIYDCIGCDLDHPPIPKEMIEDVKKYFKPNAFKRGEDMEYYFGRFDKAQLLVVPKNDDEKFQAFMDCLKTYVEEKLR